MASASSLRSLLGDPLSIVRVRNDAVWKEFPTLFATLLRESEERYEEVIAQDPKKATFESVVRAVMDCDTELVMLWGLLESTQATNRSEKLQALIEKHQPAVIAFHNRVAMDTKLYALARAVKRRGNSLPAAQKRSLHLLLRGMEQSGVHLDEKKKKRLRAINKESAQIQTTFSDNVTKSRNVFFYHITDKTLLGDMPESERHAAEDEAKKRKLDGWVFTLSPPSHSAIMRYCTDRTVRETFFRENCTVATHGKLDNRPLILKLLTLRHERARILGYKTYAHYQIADRMAKKPEAALTLLRTYAAKARRHAKKQLRQLQEYADLSDFQWWDMSFYSRTLREKLFHLDEHQLRQYFPYASIMQGIFGVAEKLFDVTLTLEHEGVDAVEIYTVKRAGKQIGTFILDPYARPEKRDGAWCDALREPIVAPGKRREYPIAVNVSNAPAPQRGKPSLLRHGEVQTFFHEFGHALHLLLSDTSERNLHSFHTEWDFVELPSQLFENWGWEWKVLQTCARHHETGKPIPRALVEKLRRSRQFLQGIHSLVQVEFAMLDMTLHTTKPPRTVKQLDALAAGVSKRYGVLPTGAISQRYASFQHLFAGGYGAGYYSYLWADILQADVYSRFAKEGILSRRLGEKLRKEILAAGTSRPGLASFKAFMGRGPNPAALLRQQGLA